MNFKILGRRTSCYIEQHFNTFTEANERAKFIASLGFEVEIINLHAPAHVPSVLVG